MRTIDRTQRMAPTLDDLLNDNRLGRLFSKDARDCALQLWILQIKSEQSIQNRIVYGRLLPYSHSSDQWSSSDDDRFIPFGQFEAQVIKVNLFVRSTLCASLLRLLSAGRTISEVSEELKLGISDRSKARFGATALSANSLVFRPVAYLLNRDAYDKNSPSSPHGGAGAFSASITQTDKVELFRLGPGYDIALTASVVTHLNKDTGLDFAGVDTTRFGDIELLVFPALDDRERRLLSVSWTNDPPTLVARFNPMQVPQFSGFQFRLSIANDSQIVYSGLATAERDKDDAFSCRFEVSDQLRDRTDSTELEIFGFHAENRNQGTLCCRWRVGYLRELNLQGHVVGQRANAVKFDWLEKTTRASARVQAALTINRGNMGFGNRIGGRQSDPWVPANRDLAALFARLHPSPSEGQFFLRWGQSDGEGRLQFVEWFRKLLSKYQQHQLVIFDPYFEDAGLGLMLLCAAPDSDYIVFTSLPKQSKVDEAARDALEKPIPGRINNLVASCEHNSQLLQRIKLRIYGLKEGRLHDRYILVMGSDGLPVAGFNLSNSFQKAAENYPLLVTPIPADTLLKVEQYKSALLKETEAAQPEGESENPTMRLLFDSKASTAAPRRYEPLRFLERIKAGDVLSVWTGQPSLQGLSGDPLKERMEALGVLKDDSLALPETAGLRNCLAQLAGNFASFTETWEVLGEVLAHSRTEDRHFREVESEREFLDFLTGFLKASFDRTHDEGNSELAVVDARLFREPVKTLLRSSYNVHHLFHATKYAALTWPEYYTVKLLWWFAPDMLLTTAESEAANVPNEPQSVDAIRLSILSQIVSDISLSVQFDISKLQRDRLMSSNNGLLQWMGLNALERQLEKPGGLSAVLQSASAFAYPERVSALGWMIHRASGNAEKAEIYKGLVAALHETLPSTIATEEFRHLIDSMRGHMHELAWAGPWLFQDVVFPLLQNGRADTDDACEIWIEELTHALEPTWEKRPRLFNRSREGQMTNIAAFLFAHSSPTRQRDSLKSMRAILKRQQRIVQQPLASTSDWTRWDGALTVSLWILAFSRWSEYYLQQRELRVRELEELMQSACAIAMARPMDEWRSRSAGEPDELTAFLDQAEELKAAIDKSKSNTQ
ncbi:VPA1262 family protein [Burkholderia sp. AW33-5]